MRRSGTNGEVERRGGPISVSDGWGKGALAEAPFPGRSRVGPAWGRLAGNAAYLDSLGGVFKHLEAFGPAFAEPAQLLVPASWPNCQIVDLRFRHYGSAFQVERPEMTRES